MKTQLSFIAAFLFWLMAFVIGISSPASARSFDDAFHSDLILDGDSEGAGNSVGEILVWNDTQNLYVRFIARQNPLFPSDAWCLRQIRLQVATDLTGIPQEDGSPLTDRFQYQTDLDCAASFTQTVPVALGKRTFYIAAQATVEHLGGLDALARLLPSQGVVVAERVGDPPTSYFQITITEDGFLNGTHAGWCVDPESPVSQGTSYEARFYSTYGTLPAGIVDHPERLPEVNWILNQGFVGTASERGFGTYTYGDVQRAIWSLVADENSDAGLGDWSPERADEIMQAALVRGPRFVPACDQSVGILIAPERVEDVVVQALFGQTTLFELGLPCESAAGSVWGNGEKFPCHNKKDGCPPSDATFFTYLKD